MDVKKEEPIGTPLEIISQGKVVQSESLAGMKRDLSTTEALGRETAVKLKSGTEQIKDIYSRADVIMKSFVKKMATDKIVFYYYIYNNLEICIKKMIFCLKNCLNKNGTRC